MTIKQIMMHLGFSDSEYELYYSLLTTGGSTIKKIERMHLGLSKLQIQSTLHQLIEKKFISTQLNNDERIYFAEEPSSIVTLIERDLEQKENSLALFKKNQSELEGVMPDEKPTVRFFEGDKNITDLMTSRQNIGQVTMKVFYPVDEVEEFFKNNNLGHLKSSSEHKYKRIATIYNKHLKKVKKPNNVEKYLPKRKTNFSSAIEIWEDKVHIVSFKEKVCGILIENKDIAHTFSEIFDICADACEVIDETAQKQAPSKPQKS